MRGASPSSLPSKCETAFIMEVREEETTTHGDPVTNHHNPAGPMTGIEEAHKRSSQRLHDWSVNGIGY